VGAVEVGGEQPAIFTVELRPQFLDIEIDVEGRAVFRQGHAVAIQNLAAQGGKTNLADGLGFLALSVTLAREHLHVPKPPKQKQHPAQDAHRQHPQRSVAFLDLVKDQHGLNISPALDLPIRTKTDPAHDGIIESAV
jgi:hypothetical protein